MRSQAEGLEQTSGAHEDWTSPKTSSATATLSRTQLAVASLKQILENQLALWSACT